MHHIFNRSTNRWIHKDQNLGEGAVRHTPHMDNAMEFVSVEAADEWLKTQRDLGLNTVMYNVLEDCG